MWPLSSTDRPKQFLEIFEGGTLFARTLDRRPAEGAGPAVVVTGASHLHLVSDVVGDAETIILEPVPRNTAAAVMAAVLQLPVDDVAVVMPSDHVISDRAAFDDALERATDLARQGRIVTFGITPTRPETGYGWIRQGPERGSGFDIDEFIEKPSEAVAADMLGRGGYLWNSGMFVARADTLTSVAEETAPEVVAAVRSSLVPPSGNVIRLTDDFANAPAVSFDKAVMEKTDRGSVVPMSAGWSDVGSWEVIWELAEKDEAGNVIGGESLTMETSNSLVRSSDRPVAVVGLDGVVVVSTPEGVLVMAKDRAQDVRAVVERLGERRNEEE